MNTLPYKDPLESLTRAVEEDVDAEFVPKIIFVDLDGTISYNPQEPGFADRHADYSKAKPIPDRIAHINKLYEQGHSITIWTARGGVSGTDYYRMTEQQLEDWGVKYTDLQVGNKPHFDMYICDKSYNSETYFHKVVQGLP